MFLYFLLCRSTKDSLSLSLSLMKCFHFNFILEGVFPPQCWILNGTSFRSLRMSFLRHLQLPLLRSHACSSKITFFSSAIYNIFSLPFVFSSCNMAHQLLLCYNLFLNMCHSLVLLCYRLPPKPSSWKRYQLLSSRISNLSGAQWERFNSVLHGLRWGGLTAGSTFKMIHFQLASGTGSWLWVHTGLRVQGQQPSPWGLQFPYGMMARSQEKTRQKLLVP